MKCYFLILIITLSLMSNILPSEMIIDQSGLYKLGLNIASLPTGPDSIIIISANDVLLDLGEHIISQDSATANINGIIINSGFQNVTIQNGTIKNVTNYGIFIGSNCGRININNIIIQNCANGISVDGNSVSSLCHDIEIDECNFFNCCNTVTASADIIRLFFTHRVRITNCTIAATNNAQAASTINVFNLQSASSSLFKNLKIDRNIAATINLFTLSDISSCLFFNSTATRNTSNVASFQGFALNNSSNNIFEL